MKSALENEEINQKAEILKALAHPIRLCIVKGLIEKGDCNVGYMQECLGVPQTSVSQHLAKLRSLGIVASERQGLEVIYRIKNETVARVIKALFADE